MKTLFSFLLLGFSGLSMQLYQQNPSSKALPMEKKSILTFVCNATWLMGKEFPAASRPLPIQII